MNSEERHEYFRELDRLIADVQRAERVAYRFKGSRDPKMLEQLRGELDESVEKLKKEELEILDELWAWFAPVGEWDEYTTPKGTALGQRIFDRVRRLQELAKDM